MTITESVRWGKMGAIAGVWIEAELLKEERHYVDRWPSTRYRASDQAFPGEEGQLGRGGDK